MPAPQGNELARMPMPPYGYPGYPPQAYPHYGYPGWPPAPPQNPSPGPSKKESPAPAAAPAEAKDDSQFKLLHELIQQQAKAAEDARKAAQKEKDDAKASAAAAKAKAEEDKLSEIAKLILDNRKQNEEAVKKLEDKYAKEKAEKEAADAKAAAEKKAQEEKNKELKEAAEKAKKKAEEEAAKKAAEEKEKWDKEMEELKKKAAEVEEAKKKAEEEVKNLTPGDDLKKAPIKFKDAVGRKFSFPWHICKTWKVSRQMRSIVKKYRISDGYLGHGNVDQSSVSTCRWHWSACPRRPLRPDWTRRRDHPSSSLGDRRETRLGHLHAHVADARAAKTSACSSPDGLRNATCTDGQSQSSKGQEGQSKGGGRYSTSSNGPNHDAPTNAGWHDAGPASATSWSNRHGHPYAANGHASGRNARSASRRRSREEKETEEERSFTIGFLLRGRVGAQEGFKIRKKT